MSLDRTPELWTELEKDSVTLREACGNTVRNVTASADAGISPYEPFDVTPYADAVFKFFLRNPVCEEMGRKFKIFFLQMIMILHLVTFMIWDLYLKLLMEKRDLRYCWPVA